MTRFELCTMPTQFTGGKTKMTLAAITKRYLLNKSDYNTDSHLIEIIVTNNSLQETEQWKCRTKNTFSGISDINIDIISSKSKDFKNIEGYISKILGCDKKENLPNILIVCFHKKRVCDDLIKLFEIFRGKHPLILPQISEPVSLCFNVSLDEADANIGVTKNFLKKIKPFIHNDVIHSITFITATAIPKLWDALRRCDIHKLLNMNYYSTSSFSEDYKDYRAFKDHSICIHENSTKNPLQYIMEVFPIINNRDNDRKVIFAPAHLFTSKEGVGSHTEVMEFFKTHGYTVLIMNGKKKAFVNPDGTEMDLIDFNSTNNITGELRDTLRVWYEQNSTKNIAITGNAVIERGVTFNTDGFNFTDMILSDYHSDAIGKLVQISGRSTGGKKYVKKMFVHCTNYIKNTIERENERLKNICELNPEYFNRTDFVDSKNAVPIKVIFHDMSIHKLLVELQQRRADHIVFDEAFKRGYRDKKIELIDNNNIHKLDLTTSKQRKIKNIKMFAEGHSQSARRFKNFHNAHETYGTISQSGNSEEYNLDFCKDRFVHDGFVNEVNVGWITYRI